MQPQKNSDFGWTVKCLVCMSGEMLTQWAPYFTPTRAVSALGHTCFWRKEVPIAPPCKLHPRVHWVRAGCSDFQATLMSWGKCRSNMLLSNWLMLLLTDVLVTWELMWRYMASILRRKMCLTLSESYTLTTVGKKDLHLADLFSYTL